jgi:DNA primase
MQFSVQFKEQLRSRILLSELVRRKVRLMQKTKGTYLGLCPFHNEKTPSFKVDDIKGVYHCFGCKASGDAISFIMETEGLSFVDTVTSLAATAGIDVPKPDKIDPEMEKKAQSLYEVLRHAADWYHRQLFTRQGKEALAYLHNRGVTTDTIERFGLGYAPDKRRALTEVLKEKHMTEKMLLDAGLLGVGERGEYYERFRNRIIFPISDTRNRVIAFGGRIMGDGQPKYLNSPETSVFKKSDVLYAENFAQKAAQASGSVIVVEGYMDVISMHSAGFTTAVAPLGTAVTDAHLHRLWRLAKEPVFCLDGDKAGIAAMQRVAEHSLPLLKPGYSLQFALLPQGSDPDDVLKQQGAQAMQRVLSFALPLSEMVWRIETADKKIETPDDKALLDSNLRKLSETISDKTIAEYYLKYFKKKLWELDKAGWQGKHQKHNKESRVSASLLPVAAEIAALPDFDVGEQYQQMLLALTLAYPHLLQEEEVAEELLRIEFVKPSLSSLRAAMLDILGSAEKISDKDFKLHLEKNGYGHDINYLRSDSSLAPCFREHAGSDAKSLWYYFLNQYNLTLMQRERQAAIREMTEESMGRAAEYLLQIQELEKKIATLQLLLQKEEE